MPSGYVRSLSDGDIIKARHIMRDSRGRRILFIIERIVVLALPKAPIHQ
jgi:hypothetical protein